MPGFKADEIRRSDLISLIFIKADIEVAQIFLAMTEAEELMYKGHMIGIEEAMLLPHPEAIIFQEVHIEGKTVITIEVSTDSLYLEAHPDPQPGGPALPHGHQEQTMTNALAAGRLAILPDNALRRMHL